MPNRRNLRRRAAELQALFSAIALTLDLDVRNVNISRVVGGGVGIAGGVTAIIGFALIPVTFGASAVAGIVGSVIAAAGGGTAGGASIFKLIKEKIKMKQVQAKWRQFCADLRAELEEQHPDIYQRLLDERQDLIISGRAIAETGASAVGRAVSPVVAGVDAARAVAGTAPRTAARVAAISLRGSIILNAVMVGVSLFDLIDGSIELYKRKGSKVGDYCRSLAESLAEIAENGLTEEYLLRSMELY